MPGTGLFNDSKRAELFDNLFRSIDREFGDAEGAPPFHEWVKSITLDGKPFTYRRHEYLRVPYQDNHPFIVEMKANAAVNDGPQPKATHLGIVFFNQAEWAYSIWGPYSGNDRGARTMGRDIRLEDCIGQDYRWRVHANPTHIGIDSVNTNQDIYIKVVKSGEEMEFFARGSANEDWVSGGVDTKLAPHCTQGSYQIGILAKSWFLSVATTFEIDYFDIREINAKSLDITGDLTTTWGQVKGK